jgi:hypothetical protein
MDDDAYIPFTMVGPTREPQPAEPQPRRMAPVDSAETGDDDFEQWYRTRGFKLFGTGKQSAQQWYEQRKRAAKPAVAMNEPGGVLADLMDKAMRV